MLQTNVFIGPFRRRAFAEVLAASLNTDTSISAVLVENEADIAPLLDSETPVVILLERHDGDDWRQYLPSSELVSVILIAEEGRGDAQISLKNVGIRRLRTAIRLLTETPHPKIISLEDDLPFSADPIRNGDHAALADIVAWLDAAFALALERYASARGQSDDAAWMQDLTYLRRHFSRDATITSEIERERFATVAGSPSLQQWLTTPLGLTPEDLRLLCLVAAPDLDQRYCQAIGLLQNNYAEPRPSATTLARFFSDEHIGADIDAILHGPRSFARLRMIRTEADQAQPGYRVPLEILELLHGVRRCTGVDWWLQTSALDAAAGLRANLSRVFAAQVPPLVIVTSDEGNGADEMAAALVALDIPVLRVNCAKAGAGAAARMADWVLAARIRNAALVMDGLSNLPESDQNAILSSDIGELARCQIVIGSSTLGLQVQTRGSVHMAVPKPGIKLVGMRWKSAIDAQGIEISDAEAQDLGAVLRLSPSEIWAIGHMIAGATRLDPTTSPTDMVKNTARVVAASHAPETVRRPPCIFDWKDIVLPKSIKQVLKTIPDHVRYGPKVLDTWDFASRLPYGRGVGALFSGPSGTGKTMCAQVIAKSLGVELMQVELSRCVSKYIGETEKNIDRCFAAAEASSAVLLFDEADALFGKRTEIKDAHDRYANVEVAYLLQRIEAFEGLVILTTNLKTNIDPAFLRRLRFVVDFPMPGAADRSRIWELAMPRKARCAPGLDTAFLANRLPLSGGSIQSIAVNAAFAAAAAEADEIAMPHIMSATRAELIKNGLFTAERELPDPTLALPKAVPQ